VSSNSGRVLSNARSRRLMLAVQEVMGRSGLTTILRQAGLQRYAGNLPPSNQEAGMNAAEYAALMQAIENYYGRGARGTLNRIGHATFTQLLQEQKIQSQLTKLALQVQSQTNRKLNALKWLAKEIAAPRGEVTVQAEGDRIIFTDHESDATFGRTRDSEICWVTLGEVQEAVKWATGADHEVAEVHCKAKGDPACRFEVGEALS